MEEDWRRLMDEQWLHGYMEEWRDWGHLTIRAKWTMDGATTLAEAAQRFRERAEELDQLAQAGFELDQPVCDDYAIVIRPDEESPMRLVEEEED
jgi:hypothetical protein